MLVVLQLLSCAAYRSSTRVRTGADCFVFQDKPMGLRIDVGRYAGMRLCQYVPLDVMNVKQNISRGCCASE